MDVSKLKFDIEIAYDCDEGEGDALLVDGTYEQAEYLIENLCGRKYITGYYHYMSIDKFDVHDENGELLDLGTILDGDYEWVSEYCSTDKDEAIEIPEYLMKFLEDLKNGEEGKRAREGEELKDRISKLKNELKEAEEKLANMIGKTI